MRRAMQFRSLAVTLVLSLAACSVGEVDLGGGGVDASVTTDTGGGGAGEASFNAQIKPLVTNCLGCHAGVSAPNLSSFSALEAKYKMGPGASNILVTKGSLTGGTHQGVPYFDTTQQMTVATWIDSL